MCGITGMISTGDLPRGIVNRSLVNGYLAQKERGNQSFGALIISKEKSIVVKNIKFSLFIEKFSTYSRYTSLFMFHHRWASVGNISNENTHPFVAGNTCLVHNGTWVGASLYKNEFPDLKGDTDSEVIAHMVEKYGLDALKKIDGSASLVWVNKEKKSINFWRKSTPMHIAFVPSKKVLLFASTSKAINMMASALTKKVCGIFDPCYEISTKEGYVYSMNLTENFSLPENPKINISKEKYMQEFRIPSYYYGSKHTNSIFGSIDEKDNNYSDESDIDYVDYDNYDCSISGNTNQAKTTIDPVVYRSGKKIF